MPHTVRNSVNEEFTAWAEYAVDGHFEGKHPWYPYHELFHDSAARLVGAHPGETVMMNGLTGNLHLRMVSFYRPSKQRYKILMEAPGYVALVAHPRERCVHRGEREGMGTVRHGVERRRVPSV